MAATTAADVSTVDLMTVQEKLLLSQAVYKLGAANWAGVSKLLFEHPCCIARPVELFSIEACEKSYVALMTSIGQNVPAEDAMKPQAKVHLRLAQTFYIQRMQELKDAIETQETKFQILMTEIKALRSGDMDAQLLGELRGVLGKKYGKKNLDAWVPEAVDIKLALTSENDVEMTDAAPEDKEPVVQTEVEEPVVQAADASEEAVLEAMASPAPVPETEKAEDIGVVTVPEDEDDTVAIVTQEDANKNSAFDEEPDYPEPGPDPAETIAQAASGEGESSTAPKKGRGRPAKVSRRNTKARSATPVASPTPAVEEAASPARSELSPAPGSDLSPAPSPSPVKDEPTRGTKRKARPSSKAAAAVQPPAKSRAPRGAVAAATAVAAASPASTTVPDSEMTSDAGEEEEDGKAKPLRETRGRRGKQAQSNPVSSPPPSKARGSSPPAAKRGGSASSQGPDETVTTPRTSRRTAKDRKAVDNTSKLSISNTAEDEDNEEQVKEEEEETEPEKPTRSNEKKKKKGAPATAAETPVATRTSNRRESARALRSPVVQKAEDESDVPSGRVTASATPDLGERASEAAGSQPPRTMRETRQSAPRDVKSNQKFIYSLLDAISQHRNGNIFQNPIKKSDAPDYYDIIKRPMDLKTIRGRIRDGQITTVEEFERDLLLMLSNAMMYNAPGSHIHQKAKEMSEESESVLAQFKSLQHYR